MKIKFHSNLSGANELMYAESWLMTLYLIVLSFLFITDDDSETTVSVLLDGEETTMDFIDVAYEEVRFACI